MTNMEESLIEMKEEFSNDPFASLETLNNYEIISITPYKCSILWLKSIGMLEQSFLGSIVPGPRQAVAYSHIYTSFLGSIVPRRE